MIPKVELLPSTVTDFSTGLIGTVLDNEVLACEVIEELNGQFELEMRYPIDGEHYSEIGYRSLILVKPNPYDDPEPFRVYKIVPNAISRIAKIFAQHISYDLAGIVTTPFTASSATIAFSYMVSNSVTPCPFTFVSTVQTSGTMKPTVPMSIRKLQGGVEGSIIDVFGGEYRYNRLTVNHVPRRGADRGSEIRYGKNLKTLEQEKNCASVYTAIFPYYYSDEDGLIQGDLCSVSGTFDFVRVLDLDCSSEFDETPTKAQLNAYAQDYAIRNAVGVPAVSLKIDFVMLENTAEYKDAIALADRVFLGDTVGVLFEKMGVNVTARVIRLEYDVLADHYTNVEVGKAKSDILGTVSSTAKAVEGVTQGLNQTVASAVEGAVQRATANLTGQVSGHIHFVYDEDGQPTEMMILVDSDDPLTATKVWRFNSNGLGYSKTGINGEYALAMTANGEIVADLITAGELDGSVVRAGTISMEDLNNDVKSFIQSVANGIELSVTEYINTTASGLSGKEKDDIKNLTDALGTLSEAVESGDAANAGDIQTLTSHVNITGEGIRLVVEEQQYEMWIKPDGVYISNSNGDSICKFTASGVLLPMDTEIPEGGTFTIGRFRWTPRESGNLSMVYVG